MKYHNLIFLNLFYSAVFFFISISIYGQSNLERVLKSGEIIVNGLSILKKDKSESKPNNNSKVIESVCVKNKLNERIIFKLQGKDYEDNTVIKELVIPKDGNECCLEIPKGIYIYEIILPNKEVFKKGEYRFTEDITITVKPD
jgi:hypothetical protein